uniref:Uncharacterized protein n=1 Tax=Anopheles atroparvus TaxID=41427 RepID=A0A182JMA3_ANOAO
MGAHGSKEKLSRSASERFVHTQVLERERFGSFGKRVRGGPAKKRDVRTINSSSSDLGPPSKTNGAQPARSSAARAAAALQKRISPNLTNASSPLVPEQLKASPPTKRNVLLKRNGTASGALPVKTPLKVYEVLYVP